MDLIIRSRCGGAHLLCDEKKGNDSLTVHVTSYLRNLADLPHRFSANLRAAKSGCP